jgi:hypothetical protein
LASATLAKPFSLKQSVPMQPALRFLWASLAATLAAMALLTLTLPLYLLAATGTVTGAGVGPSLIGVVAMLPFVTVIGGMIALPAAALAGGAMLWWQKQRGAPLTPSRWIMAGAAAGLFVSFFVGTNDADWARMITAPWFALAGALGAWVFARVWGR